jgi:hypothetical protein
MLIITDTDQGMAEGRTDDERNDEKTERPYGQG